MKLNMLHDWKQHFQEKTKSNLKSKKMNQTSLIPSEVVRDHILPHLDSHVLFSVCPLVCRKWYDLAWKTPCSLVRINYNPNDRNLPLFVGLGRFNNVRGVYLMNFDCSMLISLLSSSKLCQHLETLIINGSEGNHIGKERTKIIFKI